ncbi:MAG: SDR family NAD(P)-dependent oxidoreductase [Phreatobacter sp.]|uniref:SDR family NAD(P)-dependent oxidoreductase n=1 Tax=Phreatobacter sp. TaxID=1966341 RepID=UPI00273416F0|nr:SDR family NAD(P)-dependent oxidoreductase [Phreatobacter sp.]MDP2801846.1 SDR family NAD(P)-dependent oxidoreductase [Phreatobacter sp.]
MTDPVRTAIVTGAASGIGRATAERLARAGRKLVLVDINAAPLATVGDALREEGADVRCHVADATSPQAAEATVASALEAFGSVDILANIAGGAGPRNLHQIDEIGLDDWDLVMGLNLRSTFLWCRAVVPLMREAGYGRIINTSSTLARGKMGPVGTAGARLPYAAAKAGILGFTSQLAKDVGRFGITVNAVMPWLAITGQRMQDRYDALTPEARQLLLSRAPAGRPAKAAEIAAAIAFLASDEASYMSGVGLPVDGGFLE